jgi:hypothetical protein
MDQMDLPVKSYGKEFGHFKYRFGQGGEIQGNENGLHDCLLFG